MRSFLATIRPLPTLAGVVTGIFVIAAVGMLDLTENHRHQQEIRAKTLQQLSTLRANTERSLNKRLYLTLGLKAHVACRPNLDEAEFASLAALLLKEGEGIRSATLIKDNVISDVYPREGNEKAIGLRLLDHPEQKTAVLRAIATGKPWLAGPVKLIQGGEAFIHRAPVFETARGGPPGEGRYWGLVSILIDKDTLLADIPATALPELRIAIRGQDALGNNGGYFLGDPSIEKWHPLALNVSLPTGGWQVLGVPRNGWPTHAPVSVKLRLGGLAVSLLAGGLVFLILQSNAAYKDARRQADAASLAKSAFLANMSHEIRTPLTAILGFAEILHEEAITPAARTAVETIHRNGTHLHGLINDILDVSKIEAGKLVIEHIRCSPINIVEDVATAAQMRADNKGVKIEVELSWPLPETVETDPTRLRQILLNLVGNAVKFTESGTVGLRLRMSQSETGAPRLEFEVADTGIGMTRAQLSELFQPFMQADASTSRKYGGTGLGLVISKRLIEMLGGTICVESEFGSGTTFRIVLPIDLGSEAELIHSRGELAGTAIGASAIEATPDCQSAKSAVKAAPLSGVTVLVADDGPDNRRLIRFILEKAGATVTVVENGLQAVERVLTGPAVPDCEPTKANETFDVILMDMQMPVLDGYQATERLRKGGYLGPVLALTANAMKADEERCLAAGCNGYETKPIDRNRLLSVVATYAKTALSATCPGQDLSPRD